MDTVVLEVGPVLSIVDYFVITSAASNRLGRAIAEEVEEQLRLGGGGAPLRVEGTDDARWILIDYGDIVVHVLSEEARAYYDLERLWGDVGRLEWEDGLTTAVGAEAVGAEAVGADGEWSPDSRWSGGSS